MKKVLAVDWDKLIPGHPGAPNGRLGTKQDVQSVLTRSSRTRRPR